MAYVRSYLYGFLLALVLASHLPSLSTDPRYPLILGFVITLGVLLAALGILSVPLSTVTGWILGFFWGFLHNASYGGTSQVGQSFQVFARNSWQIEQGPFLAKAYSSHEKKAAEIGQKSSTLQLFGPHPVGAIGVLAYSVIPKVRPLWSPHGEKRFYLAKIINKGGEKLEPGNFEKVVTNLKSRLKNSFRDLCRKFLPYSGQRVESWLIGIYLGDQTEIPEAVKSSFKRVGLYHLLSVGGLHVTVLSALGTFLLRAPLIGVYGSGKLLKPHHIGIFFQILNLLGIGLAFFYLMMAGATPGVQRSVLLYVYSLLGLIFWGRTPLLQRAIGGLFIQSLLFPIGFLSEGAVMSWVCYLRVSHLLEKPGEFRQKFMETLMIQFELAVLSGAFFGEFSLMGLAANGCLIAVFTALFVMTLVLIIPQVDIFNGFVVHLHKAFLDLVDYLAGISTQINMSYLQLNDFDWKLRGGFVVLAAFFVMINCAKICREPPLASF